MAGTPEEAAENITLSEQAEPEGVLAVVLTYVAGERSDAAGIANVYGVHPDGRRVRVTHIERSEGGSWAPPNMHLAVTGKTRDQFATDEEFAAYDAFDDPDAIWSWGVTTGGTYCDGHRDPVPAP